MSTLAEIEAAADSLSAEQKQELLVFLAARLGAEAGASKETKPREGVEYTSGPSEIKKTPGVSGGAACVRDTRIPVWTLVQLKKLGRSEEQLIADFPSLTQADLDAVWQYYRGHSVEIDEAIAAEERED
jgi:uncharacterized protein (DUF433 family)